MMMGKSIVWGRADNFFVITSENVCEINKSHLFGYFIAKERCYKNCDLENEEMIIDKGKGYGQYIYLKKNGSDIQVFGDNTGSICLYVYEDDDYWAFSNSFWMLCDEVTQEHQITLDERFAMHYINVSLASLSVKNTLAKEIKVVPVHSVISIKGTKLMIELPPSSILSCSIDSEEALSIIDEWIADWTHMIRSIVASGYPIRVDLSGGFDSRVTFSLAMVSGIDFNAKNVCLASLVPVTQGQMRDRAEDYEIAKKISKHYGIELNKNVEGYVRKSLTGKQDFDLAWHSLLAVHKEPYFCTEYNVAPRFVIEGSFGEVVRGKVRNFDSWLTTCEAMGTRNSAVFSYLEFMDSIDEVKGELTDENAIMEKLYVNTWNRYHFGLSCFQQSCRNEYVIAPLSDSRLLQIEQIQDGDSDLIYAVIMMRICPEILKFPFSYGESFSEKTLDMAARINSRKRLSLRLTDRKIDFDELGEVVRFEEASGETLMDALEILENFFRNEKNKKLFLNKFGTMGEEIYCKMWEEYKKAPLLFPESKLVPVVAVMKMLQYEKNSSAYNNHRVLQRQQHAILDEMIEKYPNSKKLKMKNGIYIQKIFQQQGIKTIGVYGAGVRGRALCDDLQWSNIEIVFAVDQNPKAILPGIRMVSIDEEFPQVDAVIVTPEGYFEEIKKFLLKKDETLELIDLEALIE